MEDLLKVLYFYCLLSFNLGLEFKPSLNINTPIDFSISKVSKPELDKSTSSRLNRECYCVPRNVNSVSVINYLNYENKGDIRRLVVYLYMVGEDLKIYIPNIRMQEIIPDPYFDENEGDILKLISSQSIVGFLKNNPDISMLQSSPFQNIEEVNPNESEFTQVVSNNPHLQKDIIAKPINVNNDNFSGDQLNDYSTNSEQVHSEETDDSFEVENESIEVTMTPAVQKEDQVYINMLIPQLSDVINSDNINNWDDISLPLPQNVEETSPSEVNNIKNQHKGYHIPPMQIPIPQESNINYEWNEISNIESVPFEHQSELHLESTNHQNSLNINANLNRYPTFYEWFEDQLTRVVLYNLGTPSKILGLRDRIKKVLMDNGMHLSLKGDVTYPDGKLVEMNTLKMRPILIGDQIEYQSLLHKETNLKDSVVAYTQLIEIIIGIPPRLLGTLMMGTVLLPRNLTTAHIHLWGNHHIAHTILNGQPHLLGCISCKTKQSYSPLNGKQYKYIIPNKSGSYLGRPVRIGFTNDDYIVMRKKISDNQLGDEQVKQANEVAGRNGIDGIFGGLLNLLPNRRLLGGIHKSAPKIPNSYYPNDELPGFRIIGGNAATSSGTPLVSKGRSGFKKTSFII